MNRTPIFAAILIALGVGAPLSNGCLAEESAPSTASVTIDTSTLTPGELRERIIQVRNQLQAAPTDSALSLTLARLYLDAGDPPAAEEQLRRAIDAGAGAEAWLLLGKTWLLLDKTVEIQAQIPDDAMSTPTDKAALAVLKGYAWLAKDRPADARESFMEAQQLAPGYSPAFLGLSRVNLAEDNLAAATDALTSAEGGEHPDVTEIETLRGEIALKRNDLEGAERAYQAAVNSKPYQPWLRRPLADVQLMSGKLDAADRNIDAVLTWLPGDVAATYLKARGAYQRGNYQEAYNLVSPMLGGALKEPGAYLLAGSAAYRLGSNNQTRELLGPYLASNPNDTAARQTLAAAQINLDDPDAALETLQPLTDGPTPNASALALAGIAHAAKGQPERGVGLIERALAMEPDNPELEQYLSSAKLAGGNNETVIAELERLIAAGGQDAPGLQVQLLEALLRTKDYQRLLTEAQVFADQYPQRSEGWLYTGIANSRLGAHDIARGAFEKTLALAPDSVDARVGLAEGLQAAGDIDGAIAQVQAALELRPDDPALLGNLTRLEQVGGRLDATARRLEQQLDAAPNDTQALFELAALRIDQGDPLAARMLLSERADPQSEATQLLLGAAALRAARNAEAIAAYRQALSIAPDSIAARLGLARAYLDDGNIQEARKSYQAARETEAGRALAELGLARIAITTLNPKVPKDEAQKRIDQAGEVVRRNPGQVDSALLLAQARIAVGQVDVAQTLLREAYDASKNPDILVALVDTHLRKQDTRAAISALSDHLQEFPKDVGVRLFLGRVLLADKQTQAAVEQYEQILTQGWEQPNVHLDLAIALLNSGQKDRARRHFAAGAKDLPDDPRVPLLEKQLGRP